MAKKILVETDVTPDYIHYVYFCSPDERTGYLNIVQSDRVRRGQKKKEVVQ